MNSTLQKIPGIGDIPILGLLFKSKAAQQGSDRAGRDDHAADSPALSSGVTPALPRTPEPFLPPIPAKKLVEPLPPAFTPARSGMRRRHGLRCLRPEAVRARRPPPRGGLPSPASAAAIRQPAASAGRVVGPNSRRAALEQHRRAGWRDAAAERRGTAGRSMPRAAEERGGQAAESKELKKPGQKAAKARQKHRDEQNAKAAREQAKRDAEAAKAAAEEAKRQAKKDAEAAKVAAEAGQARGRDRARSPEGARRGRGESQGSRREIPGTARQEAELGGRHAQ